MIDKPNITSKAGGRTTALLASFPEHLKDHANFKKIYNAIADAGSTKHSHGEIGDWAKCDHCQKKANDRLLMMKGLGFQSKAHYLTWIKIHSNSAYRDPIR